MSIRVATPLLLFLIILGMVKNPIFCSACGASLVRDASFCAQCGKALSGFFNLYSVRIKRVFELVLSGCLITSGLTLTPSAFAVADGPVNCGTSGTFTITNNIVTANTACTGTVVVPSGVTEIATGALNIAAITSINLPSSVTSIGNGVFNGATTVTKNCGTSGNFGITSNIAYAGRTTEGNCNGSIVVPEGVTSIGSTAFYLNTQITTVSLPTTLTSIGDNSFRTTSITSVNIPATVTSIGSLAFSNNLQTLASVNFQGTSANSGLTISSDVFQYVKLTTITFPANLVTLHPSVFSAANKLVSINFRGNAPAVSTDFTGITAPLPTVYANSTATDFTSPSWKGLNFISVAPPAFSYASSPQTASAGTPITTATVTSTGGTITSYSINPAITNTPGLTFDTTTGAIAGTPTQVAASTTYTVTATGTLSATSTSTYSITVNAAPVAQTITFPDLSPVKLGAAAPTLSATASSNLTVTYTSATTSVCTVTGTTITILTTGTCTINANQAGNVSFLVATQVQKSFLISPVPVIDNGAAKRAAEQQELINILALIPKIGELTLSLGEATKSLYSTKCVKGKTTKYVNKGSKCPKGYVKK